MADSITPAASSASITSIPPQDLSKEQRRDIFSLLIVSILQMLSGCGPIPEEAKAFNEAKLLSFWNTFGFDRCSSCKPKIGKKARCDSCTEASIEKLSRQFDHKILIKDLAFQELFGKCQADVTTYVYYQCINCQTKSHTTTKSTASCDSIITCENCNGYSVFLCAWIEGRKSPMK